MDYLVEHEVQDNKGRFFVTLEGMQAELTYELSGDVIIAYHTYTAPKLRGRGIAAQMARALVDYARRNVYRIRPVCSYVAQYLQQNEELSGLLERH